MNGFITSRIHVAGGIDEATGMPFPESETWTDPIECQYVPNRRNTVGANREGKFRIASYEITVNMLDWNIYDVSMIRLINEKKEVITEAEVLTLDELEAIQRIKITI